MRELKVMLKIAQIQYFTRPTRIAVTKNIGTLTVDGGKVELQKGIEIEVPYWLAKAVEEEGAGNIIETPLSLEDIARIHYTTLSARTPADLEPLPQYFYQEVREYLRKLDERIHKELNPSLLEEKQKVQQYLIEILDKRLTIIFQSLRSPTSIAELQSKLTLEEQAILKTLQNVVEAWKKLVLPLTDTGQ